MGKRKATFEVCDNPECDNECEVDSYEPVALGYHIVRGHFATGGGGGPIPKTYACSLECLAPAIQHNIKEAW